MRIVIAISSLESGGRERQVVELLKGLREYNIEFKVVSFSSKNSILGLEEFSQELVIFNQVQSKLFALFNFSNFIRIYKPDIVHTWDHLSTLMCILPKLFFNFRIIDGSIRGAKYYFRRKLFLFLTNLFTTCVVSNSLAGLKSIGKRESKKFRIIYNGIQFDRFLNENKANLRNNLLIDENSIVIGMVANIRRPKDYNSFLRAAKEITRNYPGTICFVSVGEGILDPALVNYMQTWELNRNVKFLGKIDNVESIITQFNICVLLNDINYGIEGISNAIMEYMVAEKPVIATNAGGNSEIVVDKFTGFLIEPFDIDSLVLKLKLLIDNEDLRLSMGKCGRRIIELKFSHKSMIERYYQLYSENIK